jgi:hypothetical protein
MEMHRSEVSVCQRLLTNRQSKIGLPVKIWLDAEPV